MSAASNIPALMRVLGSWQTTRCFGVALRTFGRSSRSSARKCRSRSSSNADADPSPLPPHAATQPRSQQAATPPPSPYEVLLEGKRFVCTECGKCCQGSGEVWCNEAECAAIAKFLGLQLPHFLSRFTKAYSRRPGWRMLKLQQGTGDCIFLTGGTKCSIYGARPMQCSTYPYWPELMDPAAWVTEGRAVCEGIEHKEAPLVDAAEKAGVLRAATEYFAEQQMATEAGRPSKALDKKPGAEKEG